MLMGYENNYTLLSKIHKQEQNALMTHRLKNVKSTIKTTSPKYFSNFRKRPNKSQEKKDLSKPKNSKLF
jgi:hypothetical protein